MAFLTHPFRLLALAALVQNALCEPLLPRSPVAEDGLVWTVGQAVKTTSGTVVGHPAPNVTDVSEYLGIPYAQAPIGNLRFAPPVGYTSNSTITASAFSPDCPANIGALGGSSLPPLAGPNSELLLAELAQLGNALSEDCLSINVWTKPQTGEKAKAVLLWIYGGGFATGSANNPAYIGKYFAENEDVVVVSFNYRVNVFGFPGLPVDGVAQNAGLLDQRLAAEWVRANIGAFGGDPTRITLFGQSAGGGSVDYYTYAWTKDPIVNAFIPQSGTATSFGSGASNNTAAWFNASIALGCGDASVGLPASVACVRTKPYQAVLNATKVSNPLQAVLGNFGPTVDGTVVFSDYDTRALAGNFIKRPYFTGNANYEAGLFKILATGQGISDSDWCIFDLAIFTCPAAKAAGYRALHGLNTFRYRWYGEFPNTRLTLNPPSGSWHGSEIPQVFQTAELASQEASTPTELAISATLHHTWASFAKDPERALYGYPFNFPQYNPNTASLIEFGNYNISRPQFALPISTDSLCTLIDAVGALLPGGFTGLLSGGGVPSLPGNISLPVTCSPLS